MSWQPVWTTDVLCLAPELFVANVTDLPAFTKQMISYQKVCVSGCWKSLAMLWLELRLGTVVGAVAGSRGSGLGSNRSFPRVELTLTGPTDTSDDVCQGC